MFKYVDGEEVQMAAEEVAAWQAAQTAALPTLDEIKAQRSAVIEASVVAIYQKPITLAREYEAREAAAQSFKNAGYTGTPGQYLKDFADFAALDYASAADRVLAQAVAFRNAEPVLAAQRMRKYEIQRATTIDAVDMIYGEVQTVLASVIAQIG